MTGCDELIRPTLESAFTDATLISEDDGDCRITVPFERADGDIITLWIKRNGEKYHITDEGETFGLLYLSNINIDQERRKQRVSTVKDRFGLNEAKNEVRITTDRENIGRRILDAVQAVQALSYLTYTRRQYTQTDFRADVGEYLTEEGFHLDHNPEVSGTSENHRVDFALQNVEQPTYLEALHAEDISTSKSMAQRTMYKWVDIKQQVPNAVRISVLDDESGEFGRETENILRNYSDHFFPWSYREEMAQTLHV